MKRIISLVACLLLPLIHVVADNLPITGSWDEEEFSRRSLSTAPARPTAGINGAIVSVCSPDALNDLKITITDLQGSIVFQQSYSFAAGETIDLPALEEGNILL